MTTTAPPPRQRTAHETVSSWSNARVRYAIQSADVPAGPITRDPAVLRLLHLVYLLGRAVAVRALIVIRHADRDRVKIVSTSDNAPGGRIVDPAGILPDDPQAEVARTFALWARRFVPPEPPNDSRIYLTRHPSRLWTFSEWDVSRGFGEVAIKQRITMCDARLQPQDAP